MNPPEPEEEIEPEEEVVPEPEKVTEEEETDGKPDVILKPEPVDGEGTITDNTTKESEEESDLTILWVIIAITAVVLIIGGFAIWKFYTTCRNKSKIKTTKVKSINDNGDGGKKSSSSKSKLKANAGP